jgi:PAS domain-containing protein
MLAKDGSNIPVLISASVLLNDKGEEVGTVGFVKDVRERKREQEAFEERSTELRAARERFQYVLTVTPGVIYTTQASGDYACTFVSENIRTIIGLAPEDMLTDPKCWPDRLHPEDGPCVFEEMPPLIQRGGGTLVYRFRRQDGSYLWIQDTFKVVGGELGRPLELVGAWADISSAGAQSTRRLRPAPENQTPLSRLIESRLTPSSPDKSGA